MYNFTFYTAYTLALLSLCSVITIAFLLILRRTVFKDASGRVKYYLWLPVLLLAILPLRIKLPVITKPAETAAAYPLYTDIALDGIPDISYIPRVSRQIDGGILQKTVSDVIITPVRKNESVINKALTALKACAGKISAGLFTIWIAGVVFIIIKNAAAYKKTLRRMYRFSHCTEPKHTLTFYECRDEAGIKQNVALRVVDDGHLISPCLAGLFKPVVYIPRCDINRNEGELRLIFIHELIHVKRLDVLYAGFSLFICALHWFNPLFGVLSRLRYEDCELSCDERVLAITGRETRGAYAGMIFDMLASYGGKRTDERKLTNTAIFLEGSRDFNFIKRRFINMKKSNNKKSVIIVAVFILSALMLNVLFLSSCGVPTISVSAADGEKSRFVNPVIGLAVSEYFGGEVTDEQLDEITSVNVELVKMPDRNGEETTFADVSINGVRLGVLPEYFSKDRYENIVQPALKSLGISNVSKEVTYARVFDAFHCLVGEEMRNTGLSFVDKNGNTQPTRYKEFLDLYPMVEKENLYVLDPVRSERETALLVSIMNAAGLFDPLIAGGSFSLADLKLFGNLDSFTVNGQEQPLDDISDSVKTGDYDAWVIELIDIKTDKSANPDLDIPPVEEAPAGEYVKIENQLLYAALLDYFVTDGRQDYVKEMRLPKEQADQITSIKVSVHKEATDLLNRIAMKEVKGWQDSYSLVYEINGKPMGLLPYMVDRGTFESIFTVKYPTSAEAEKKVRAYYTLKDPGLCATENAKTELLEMYPECATHGIYVFDIKSDEREVLTLLEGMGGYMERRSISKGMPYNTSDAKSFVNLENFEVDELLK